jgi:hypothetical protein
MARDSMRTDSEVSSLEADDDPWARRRTAREAERGSRRVAIPWIVAPAVIVAVFVVGFGLWSLLA